VYEGKIVPLFEHVEAEKNDKKIGVDCYVLNNPLKYTDPSGEVFWLIPVAGAVIFSYLGGTAANKGQLNPTKWDWQSGNTWKGIGIGAVVGATGGWAFASGGSALAGTAFFSSFANGTAAAYIASGIVTGAAAGYATGFGTGMAISGGDWRYANKLGGHYAGIGAAVGSVAGTLYGLSEQGKEYLENTAKYEEYRSQQPTYYASTDAVTKKDDDFKPWYGNFLGPGPDINPYRIKGADGKILRPINMLDRAAQRHDFAYYRANTGGISGALFERKVRKADFALTSDALEVLKYGMRGLDDQITGKPMSSAELRWAGADYFSFFDLFFSKAVR
jgi:hypothetical protein